MRSNEPLALQRVREHATGATRCTRNRRMRQHLDYRVLNNICTGDTTM
jgi:hypothetical protein